MLQAPIEGYEDAIVVPPINANNFELKQTLINLVQSNQFTGSGVGGAGGGSSGGGAGGGVNGGQRGKGRVRESGVEGRIDR
nr:reverse transcriptase domain-containing protein [Tanacetum cinerariifolium]